jgi:hypothetical protein
MACEKHINATMGTTYSFSSEKHVNATMGTTLFIAEAHLRSSALHLRSSAFHALVI